MRELYDQFIKENNLSENTLQYYEWVFNRLNDYVGVMPDKQNIKEFVIRIQQSGVSVYTAKSYIRGMNSFLSWLHENEHIELLRIKKLRKPEKILKLFTDTQLKSLLLYRPKTFSQARLHAMICFAIDTGVRINEILTLKRGKWTSITS